MKNNFSKYQGLGNDFIIFDARRNNLDHLFSKKFKAVLILTGDHLNSSADILYDVEIFKLLKIVIFFGSKDEESLLFTLASRELFILIPIPLEYPLEGAPKRAFSNLVYSAVFPLASII